MERERLSIVNILLSLCISVTASAQMTFPGEDWRQTSPEAQGIDSAKLEAAVSYLEDNCGSDGVKELVIIRNGCMIWKGTDIDKVHGVWSLTKSFTSTVLGLLIDDGKATLDTLAKDYVPSMTRTYPDVTLRHFTTMTSGYYAVGDKTSGSYKHGPSSTPFTPADTPLFSPPGSRYAYWDSAMNQFANVLTRIAGEPIEELFKRRIADRIGMNRAKWDWGDFGKIDGIVVNGGSGNSNKHMFISARELARFGHLFLNRGKWQGKQLISAEWVDMATKAHVPASIPLEQLSGADGRGVYGFNWWVNAVKADGKLNWPGAPHCTYSASGYNNNDMFIIPKWNMVIVRLGLDQRERPISDTTYSMFLAKIGQAITDETTAQDTTESIEVEKGICVVLGDKAVEHAIKLARESELLIYIQLANAEDVQAARQEADAAGLYGTRIFIDKGSLQKLDLADNIADAVVAAGSAEGISQAEVLRVLRPQGKAILGDRVVTKPFPQGADDWTHPYHGPDNNTQSNDRLIRAPYLTQFLAEPRYAPVPQVAVASGGRMFKAFGHVAFKEREEPFLNKLVAFNGYNGTMLWQRDLAEGVMIHRNTMIATPNLLYVGDDKSCKVIDAATGELADEIIPPSETADGTFWKWMAMEDSVLYALIGEQEQKDPTMRWEREAHGWPWNPISQGFNQPDKIKDPEKAYVAHPWGFGGSVLAIDPKTKKVLWSHRETEPVDGRAICMKNGRIYIFRFGAYLACIDAKSGEVLWRKTPANAPALFEAFGPYSNRQGASWNWRTTCYMKCSDDALYFAGPQVGKLLAVSTRDGRVLWSDPYNNFQLIIRDDELYAIAGQNDAGSPSKKFNALTGEVLALFDTGRRACTRPTATIDSILYRARGGSTRFDLASSSPQLVSPMRPPCQDGVTIANGLLYWWPYVCDCQLTLYGITCLTSAGDFDFQPDITETSRLETGNGDIKKIASLPESDNDWPTFRADNTCSAMTNASIAKEAKLLWQYSPETASTSSFVPVTAPVTAGGLVFTAGPDGIVRALEASSGRLQWKAFTGGAIRISPTIWRGRVFVGSGDGRVYSFEAKTGKLLWRFRAAPVERKVPLYGVISSTWPAASGVLVEDGVAYVAAGIVNYDGTYVYALDAVTGRLKWRNDTSGHLNADAYSGVSVQGHMLINDGKLYLASGNAVSPAVYDIADGKCLNDPGKVQTLTQNNVLLTQSPRGWELSLLADIVVACGRPFYAHPKYEVYDPTVFSRVFLAPCEGRDIVWVTNQQSKEILCLPPLDRRQLARSMANPRNQFLVDWRRLGIKAEPFWSHDCKNAKAFACSSNAVLIAEESKLKAIDINDGSDMWSCALPVAPVEWGLAIDAHGRSIVALENGQVMCFGQE